MQRLITARTHFYFYRATLC